MTDAEEAVLLGPILIDCGVCGENHPFWACHGPVPVNSTSWRCPYCPCSRSSQAVLARHVSRCWANPLAQSCATCANFRPATVLSDPACTVDVDLDSGEPFSALPIGCAKWEAIF